MTRKPQNSPDMRTQLSEQLNWRELIHTTYFDIPEFADLAAYGLHKAGPAPSRRTSGRATGGIGRRSG